MRQSAGIFFVVLLTGAIFSTPSSVAQNRNAIPDFYIAGGGWDMINANATNYAPPPPGIAPPVSNDPRYPHVGNLQPGNKTDRVTDLNSPLLQEWTKESIRKTNEAVIERGRTPFVATSLCWPGGVPTQLLVPTTVYIRQTPDIVWMFWERDHHVRKIYLNQPHSADPKPAWFGESVGHYEGGDTLVIDTIGLSDHPLSFVDNFRVPHTRQLHVQERWKITGGGAGVEVSFVVEDPGAFTMPWGGMMRYRNVRNDMQEFVCAENNPDPYKLNDYEMPTDNAPDF
jgi:hypothetical protein